ncbi:MULTISPECIES: hypothetical protein [Shewanella]|uniref:hypothetical protein n=1 Tax=Shewanella TaxID=22 RepID=UPI0004AD8B46|nr:MULTISPECIES: hypothetical protein [Shewanella]QLE85786.1 hypothetical protein FLM48_12325 [Shewanella sp. Scap07]
MITPIQSPVQGPTVSRIQNASSAPAIDSLTQVVTGNDYIEPLEKQSQQSKTLDYESAPKPQQELVAHDMAAKQQAQLEYDQNANTHQGAIGAYLTNQHAEQRDAISQMVGIDTYA